MRSSFTVMGRWVFVLFIALIALSTIVFFLVKQHYAVPELVIDDVPVKTTSSGLTCVEGYTAIVELALAKKNQEYCECEDDTYARELCDIAISDALLYENAVTQLDERLCQNIVELRKKEACEQVIAVSVNTANPKIVADIRLQNNDTRSIESYEVLHEARPDNIDTVLALAKMHAEKGLRTQEGGGSQVPEVEAALEYIEKAKVLDAEDARVYEIAGYVYEILPDFSMATQQYSKAIELNPQSIDAYVGRAHTANLQGLLELALNDLLKARSLDTNQVHTAVYTHLCRLQSTRHDLTAEAKTNCLIVLDSAQAGALNHAEAHQTLAKIALREGDTDTTEEHYAAALRLTPEDGNLLTSLAEYEIDQEQYAEAEAYARKAVAVTPTKAVARLSLAYALYKQQQFEEAADEAKTGLSLIDDDVSLLMPSKDKYRREFYYTLANIYHYMENTDQEQYYKEQGDQLAI